MKILAIETSCDETAIALIKASGDLNNMKFKVLNKKVHSQIEEHKIYGGVFPSLAKREHAKNIIPVIKQCLENNNQKSKISLKKYEKEIKEILKREPDLFEAFKDFVLNIPKPEIDMIAVTSGPGLEPALWVGINFARALSLVWQIPMLPVNHMEGHMASVLLTQDTNPKSEIRKTIINFPSLALLISGGHTELVEIKNWNKYKILGQTRDDAIGESYDKVARLLGFSYPGGPQISKLANNFRKKPKDVNLNTMINFPRPMINSNDLDFSFSGLKTAVLYEVQKLGEEIKDSKVKELVAFEFEQAVTDVILKKLQKALKEKDFKNIIVAGGVIANQYIRENIENLAQNCKIPVFFPETEDSTDNGQMIAVAAYIKSFVQKPKIAPKINAQGGLTY